MSKREDAVLLKDIIESGDKIFRYTFGMTFEEFYIDEKTVDAVIRNFEIIGEAANRLSDDLKDANSSIDWHKIRGFRNRIVHDYAGVDLSIVWNIIQDFLPNVIDKIKTI
ncbi:MAG: DUF86 domain-containing protein [Bacteroidetes bacterium]|nr:DUF86 domain-containing protein [Bacteroidota bacterium]MBK8342193.1 DUF86 domain-containing protein [Bacteroidota bacterium]